MKLSEAFDSVKIEKLTPDYLEKLAFLKRNFPVICWYEIVFGEKMERHGNFCIGRCPRRKHHSKDSKKKQFVVYFDTTYRWHCFCASCKSHYFNSEEGDILDIHQQHRDLLYSKQKAIDELWNLYEEHGPFDMSEYYVPGQQHPKKTKPIPKPPVKTNLLKLEHVLTKEKEITLANIKERYNHNFLDIHTSLFLPSDNRAFARITTGGYFLGNEAELRKWLTFNFGYSFMTGSTYKKSKKEDGRRSNDNIDQMLYICAEIDPKNVSGYEVTDDDQIRVLSRLSEILSLVAITHSGNVSYQGIYNRFDASKKQIEEFETEALQLFCDPKTLKPNWWFRLPQGTRVRANEHSRDVPIWPRNKWRQQRLIYFDPDAIPQRHHD